jgi:hypothetical protein
MLFIGRGLKVVRPAVDEYSASKLFSLLSLLLCQLIRHISVEVIEYQSRKMSHNLFSYGFGQPHSNAVFSSAKVAAVQNASCCTMNFGAIYFRSLIS